MKLSAVLSVLLLAGTAQATIELDLVTVGDPGNPCELQGEDCLGAVAEVFQIGKFEVSNAEYTDFLNAVAATDTNFLYSFSLLFSGDITQSGVSGSYTYSVTPGAETEPMRWVSFWSALRFANWLHNGQPTGAQNDSTTEDGAYTITPGGVAANSIVRNAGALFFVPTRDEWYKAAYFDAPFFYFDYPYRTNIPTTCTTPGATPNTANCSGGGPGSVTAAGAYTGSQGPYGSFDQGGNVWEWTETIRLGNTRVRHGGTYNAPAGWLGAASSGIDLPTQESEALGFRIASRAPPAEVPTLASWRGVFYAGLLLLAAGRSAARAGPPPL